MERSREKSAMRDPFSTTIVSRWALPGRCMRSIPVRVAAVSVVLSANSIERSYRWTESAMSRLPSSMSRSAEADPRITGGNGGSLSMRRVSASAVPSMMIGSDVSSHPAPATRRPRRKTAAAAATCGRRFVTELETDPDTGAEDHHTSDVDVGVGAQAENIDKQPPRRPKGVFAVELHVDGRRGVLAFIEIVERDA